MDKNILNRTPMALEVILRIDKWGYVKLRFSKVNNLRMKVLAYYFR